MNDNVHGPVDDAADHVTATMIGSTYMAHQSLQAERARNPEGGVRGAMMHQMRLARNDLRERTGVAEQMDQARQHIAGAVLDAYDGLVGRTDQPGSRLADVLDPMPMGQARTSSPSVNHERSPLSHEQERTKDRDR